MLIARGPICYTPEVLSFYCRWLNDKQPRVKRPSLGGHQLIADTVKSIAFINVWSNRPCIFSVHKNIQQMKIMSHKNITVSYNYERIKYSLTIIGLIISTIH